MKIKEVNAGVLTNFEVLDFLRSNGASKDPLRSVLSPVSSSELKVFDYLAESAACNQTRKNINEFIEKCSKFKLVKRDILNIINIRPSSGPELFPILEEWEERGINSIFEDLKILVLELLPPAPTNDDNKNKGDVNTEKMEGINEGEDETLNAEMKDSLDVLFPPGK